MIVKLDSSAPIIHKKIEAQITAEIVKAFQERYEINDSLWFAPKMDGETITKLSPKVVNTAEYISKRFQAELMKQNWEIEKELDDQRIDGYFELDYNGQYLHLDKDEFLEVINYLNVEDENYPEQVSMLYKCFYKMSFPYNTTYFTGKLSKIGIPKTINRKLRIGLEFETGNIASSFRAVSKLNYLFDKGFIDIGAFITSIDKKTSTRIWPSSNRNGSIEELNNRKVISQINFPYLVYGFEPESYSRNSLYLAKTGKYKIDLNDEEIYFNGARYKWDKLKSQLQKQ